MEFYKSLISYVVCILFFNMYHQASALKSKFYYLQNLILLQHQCCVDLIQLATQLFFTALCGRLFSFFNIRVELSSYKSITTEMTTRYRIISYMNIVYKIWDRQLQVQLRYLTADTYIGMYLFYQIKHGQILLLIKRLFQHLPSPMYP